MESGAISDGQITSSSQWDGNHAAIQGRLHFEAGGGKAGGWTAGKNDANQWLQVDLGSEYCKVTRVATQGRNNYEQWVTKYKLQYSNDGVHFQYYREREQTANKNFVGNLDQDTVVSHDLNPPIKARYIRFRPVAWHGHISMRVELYGCKVLKTLTERNNFQSIKKLCTAKPQILPYKSLVSPQIIVSLECQEALGMENGVISDGQISASSQMDANHAAIQARLHFETGSGKQGAWSAKSNDVNQWLQVDMDCENTAVTKVATQGRNSYGQWVTKYMLQYSNDGVTFQYYKARGQTADKEFPGNNDQDTVISHQLDPPIRARYIRFGPVAWHRHISMRVELYGCEGNKKH
ncbi:EGF-like repeat and discoidin I-like domain-containing protein 3 [Orbicella faveolata]|uniref:EGF-like repeat and discoidin I-like domain-containing protein 3 n=1 Tax=Orbicella faveolata TaxID=48498 RepID=UPI0009E1C366|nr:EGF-like repeat and discoidin I-like domain-containing protein 3 [Orbicella faveolata]